MRDHTSRLKNFDLESMSDCTPHVTGLRVTERISKYFKRWFLVQHLRQLKVSVENAVSDYGSGDLWTLAGTNPEPVELVNARSRPKTSKKHLHLEHLRLA